MSSMSAGGVGGNIGGTMQPTAQDVESTAWTVVNKERMGIVPDSIEIPFTQVGGNLWKYSTDSARPTLMPMGTLRTMAEEPPKTDETWKKQFDHLVDQLPSDIKKNLLEEYGKSSELRSLNYQALTQTLTSLAKGLTWMDKAQGTPDPNSVEAERIRHNRSLPEKAFKGMIQQGQQTLRSAESFLDKVGPNNIHHDSLRFFTNESAGLQGRLENLLAILKDPDEELPSERQMKQLCEDIGSLLKGFNKASHGSPLQILSPMLESMEAAAEALSMTPTSPSLFLGMKVALKGIFSSESAAGIFGGDLEALLNALEQGLLATLMKNKGSAKMKMLMRMLMTALGGAGILGSLLEEPSGQKKEEEEDEDEDEGRKFHDILNLTLLNNTEIIKLIYKIIAEACGQNEQEQDKTSTVLELISLLTMSLTATGGRFDPEVPLLKNFSHELYDKVTRTEQIVQETSGKEGTAAAKQWLISLQQAKMALKGSYPEELMSILQKSLAHVKATPQSLSQDLGNIKNLADLVKHTMGSGLEEETKIVTGMIQAA